MQRLCPGIPPPIPSLLLQVHLPIPTEALRPGEGTEAWAPPVLGAAPRRVSSGVGMGRGMPAWKGAPTQTAPAPPINPARVGSKMQRCPHWAQWRCKKGSRCTFAHGDHELAPKEVRQKIRRQQEATQRLLRRGDGDSSGDERPIRMREGQDLISSESEAEAPADAADAGSSGGGCDGLQGQVAGTAQSSESHAPSSGDVGASPLPSWVGPPHGIVAPQTGAPPAPVPPAPADVPPPTTSGNVHADFMHRRDGTPLTFMSRDAKAEAMKQRELERAYAEEQQAWGLTSHGGAASARPLPSLGRGRHVVRPAWLTRYGPTGVPPPAPMPRPAPPQHHNPSLRPEQQHGAHHGGSACQHQPAASQAHFTQQSAQQQWAGYGQQPGANPGLGPQLQWPDCGQRPASNQVSAMQQQPLAGYGQQHGHNPVPVSQQPPQPWPCCGPPQANGLAPPPEQHPPQQWLGYGHQPSQTPPAHEPQQWLGYAQPPAAATPLGPQQQQWSGYGQPPAPDPALRAQQEQWSGYGQHLTNNHPSTGQGPPSASSQAPPPQQPQQWCGYGQSSAVNPAPQLPQQPQEPQWSGYGQQPDGNLAAHSLQQWSACGQHAPGNQTPVPQPQLQQQQWVGYGSQPAGNAAPQPQQQQQWPGYGQEAPGEQAPQPQQWAAYGQQPVGQQPPPPQQSAWPGAAGQSVGQQPPTAQRWPMPGGGY